MSLFPLFADLKGRRVLVVGGGSVAERKVASLLKAQADVTIGALAFNDGLVRLGAQGRVRLLRGSFAANWLDGAWLAVAATGDREVNRNIAALAATTRIFVNVVDDPELSSVQLPSVVDRSPLIVAISSSGAAPVLARRVRERLESLLDHSMGPLVALAQRYRAAIRHRRPVLGQRRSFYDWLLDGPVATALRQQQPWQAERLLTEELARDAMPDQGRVILVGAGPGDPGLLTLKALRALNEADVILHDRLVSQEIRDLARRDALQISVGKTPGEDHEATQRRIHALMLEHVQAGLRVVRLKGGDAFIFGRGGEELEFLKEHGIPYEVVPGITAAIACAAYAGIPLTHRNLAQSVRLVTAHGASENRHLDESRLDDPRETLAFYMGVGQLGALVEKLLARGRSPDTPFALIENGTRPEQRVVSGVLHELEASARAHAIRAPALLIVGEVAALADRLHWFGESLLHQKEPEYA